MAQEKQNFSTVPDANTKSGDEKGDHIDPVDCDSGFISSENIIYYSGEIPSSSTQTPVLSSLNIKSENIKEQTLEQTDCNTDSGILSGDIDKEKTTSSTEDKNMYTEGLPLLCTAIEKNLNLGNDRLTNFSKSITSTKKETQIRNDKHSLEQIKKLFGQNEDGDTNLHKAILIPNAEISSAIIRIAPHPKILDIANDNAQTALHFAVGTQQHQIVRMLRLAGADPCLRDCHGNSPVHLAAQLGDVKCLEAILFNIQPQEFDEFRLRYPQHRLAKADLDQWNYSGQTPVHVAAIHGHIHILRILVQFDANINAVEGLSGFTPLHLAAERRDEKMIQFLLRDCPNVDPNARSYAGKTAWQTQPKISGKITSLFKTTGVESPYSSETEDSSGDEEMYESIPAFINNLVSSSA